MRLGALDVQALIGFLAAAPPTIIACLLQTLTCFLLLLVGLPGSLPARAEAASTAPNIMLFRVLPVMVDGEQWYEFHWEVTNTDRVQIFQDGRAMRGRTQLADGSIGWPPSMSGSLKTKLREVTTYELVAKNRAGESASRTFTVKLTGAGPATTPSAPEIVSFRVSPDTVEPGGWINFHWQVENAQSVKLLDDFGEVEQRGGWGLTENGTSSMTLRKTTTFLLVARIAPDRRHESPSPFEWPPRPRRRGPRLAVVRSRAR